MVHTHEDKNHLGRIQSSQVHFPARLVLDRIIL